MQDHEIRLKEWMAATGLKVSKATLVSFWMDAQIYFSSRI